MKGRRPLARLSLVAFMIGGSGAGTACTGMTPCTPEEHGLADASRLEYRELAGREPTPGACARPRLDVLSSDAELRKLYEELGVAPSADGGMPAVDFTRERVIVREGPGSQGIFWAVAQGETGILGLLSCGGPQPVTCAVNVMAVPAAITRAETRTCDPVGCGHPRSAPVRVH